MALIRIADELYKDPVLLRIILSPWDEVDYIKYDTQFCGVHIFRVQLFDEVPVADTVICPCVVTLASGVDPILLFDEL